MMTFSGYVKYLDHEAHTTRRQKYSMKYTTIKVQDIDTRRVYWLYDWSGHTQSGKLMKKHEHEILYVQGYLNSAGKTNFAVLQRWGIWDPEKHSSINPETNSPGYIEVLEDKGSKLEKPKTE